MTAAAAASYQVDLVDSTGIQATALIDGALWSSSEAQIRAMATAKGYTVNAYPAGPGDSGSHVSTLAQAQAWIAAASVSEDKAGATLGSAAPAPAPTDPTNTIVGTVVGVALGAAVGGALGGGRWALAGGFLGAAAGAAVGSTLVGWTGNPP